MKLNLSKNAQMLEITLFEGTHNHPVSDTIFNSLPRQRKLDEEDKAEVQEMLSLRCNMKLLKNHIQTTTGKQVLLKDMHNLKSNSENNLEETVQYLESLNGYVEVVAQDRKLEGIFFQDSSMKYAFKQNPEMVLLDATYCLNSLYMPLYILLVINGNGQGQVAGLFLLAHETADHIKIMLNIFKQQNLDSNKIQLVFTDKDFSERNAIKEVFPETRLLLCSFHTLKTFRTTITNEKMGVTNEERKKALSVLQKLVFSDNESTYEANYKKLIELGLKEVTNYYMKNWHPIRYEWVRGFIELNRTFNVTTTNHLESLNQKIKQVVEKNSNLLPFFKDLMLCLKSIHQEQKQKAVYYMTKNPQVFDGGSIEEFYHSLLTPHAWQMVRKELEKFKIMLFCVEVGSSVSCCSCAFFKNVGLPCRHIFYKRKEAGVAVGDASLIPQKFSREGYYRTYCNDSVSTNSNHMPTATISNVFTFSKPILTKQEKYKKSMLVCQNICNILSDYGTDNFQKALTDLEFFKNKLLDSERQPILENEIVHANIGTREELNNNNLETAESKYSKTSKHCETQRTREQSTTNTVNSTEEDEMEMFIIEEEMEMQDTIPVSIYQNEEKHSTRQEEEDTTLEGVSKTRLINIERKNSKELEEITTSEFFLKDISLDKMKFKRKGRPKGSDTTVIGLKKNKLY